MEIEVREHVVRICTVAPLGRVDAFNAPDLRAKLEALINEGVRYIVIDLSGTTFLDSAGMAVLVSALKRTRAMGGDVHLVSPTDPAAIRVLTLTKFDKVFKMFDAESEAIGAF